MGTILEYQQNLEELKKTRKQWILEHIELTSNASRQLWLDFNTLTPWKKKDISIIISDWVWIDLVW